jgi:hypothetical protein
MAHYYGTVAGQAGPASRLGSKKSGIMSTIETWGCTLRADLDYRTPYGGDLPDHLLDENGGMDILSVSFGPKSGMSIPLITIRNPDAVARVTDDPKIRELFSKIHELGAKIEAEAPKAERRKKREANRREREYKLQRKIQQDLREGMSEKEQANWRKLCSPWGAFDEFYDRTLNLWRDEETNHLLTEKSEGGLHSPEIVNLTTGEGVPEPIKEEV